jgi:hypothetical protein
LAKQPGAAGDREEEAEEVPWEAASPGLMRGVVAEREREEWREEDALLGCPVSVMAECVCWAGTPGRLRNPWK